MQVNKTSIKVIVHLPTQCLYTVISWAKHLESNTRKISGFPDILLILPSR